MNKSSAFFFLSLYVQAIRGLKRTKANRILTQPNASTPQLTLSLKESSRWSNGALQGSFGLQSSNFGVIHKQVHISVSTLRSLNLGYNVICTWALVIGLLYLAAYLSVRGTAQIETTKLQTELPAKEVLMTIGIVATALQGGGLIFGFSSFADAVLKMPGSPYGVNTVPIIFAVGHQVTAFGCILSGPLLNLIGPRRHAMLGLLMEAIGLVLLAFIATLPMIWTMFAYGLVGWGGCHVLMAALTLTPAFENSNFLNATLTCAFQAGGFVFMVLPFVEWNTFFIVYGLACGVTAVVFGFTFPDEPLPARVDDEESEDSTTLKDVLLRPQMIAFLITFMVAGNALIYGIGEFASNLSSKDNCDLNGQKCANQATQDYLNNIAKPLIGNLILPASLFCGWVIDKYAFSMPAFVKVSSVQIFLFTLWALELQWQIVTIFAYNIANAVVFTVQNAYICSVNPKHIGNLFAVSNLALCLGNVLVDWLSTHPFDNGHEVGASIQISCAMWIVALFPLYSWAFLETKSSSDEKIVSTTKLL
eukprot:gnl/MRDRNA2_/MRDRNA2_28353_c0_seq1.p1 gnl/MRDRNA2_/MRDRNA2_28353_c0~~gnl/MRDRNA2_/MRDRNA2_28353_c0_seq1.p1  ORF type:complete len:533 (-),score=62.18 gnl/MRDRNA2_/MRDRNA2_28353_c0_seq1:33-1631(-)